MSMLTTTFKCSTHGWQEGSNLQEPDAIPFSAIVPFSS
jgi:hypothetical protein